MLDLVDLSPELRAPRDLADQHAHEIGIGLPGAQDDARHACELLAGRNAAPLDLLDRLQHARPRPPEDGLEQILLRPEVVVDEAVRDSRLLRHVGNPARVVAGPGEDGDRRAQDRPALLALLVRNQDRGSYALAHVQSSPPPRPEFPPRPRPRPRPDPSPSSVVAVSVVVVVTVEAGGASAGACSSLATGSEIVSRVTRWTPTPTPT